MNLSNFPYAAGHKRLITSAVWITDIAAPDWNTRRVRLEGNLFFPVECFTGHLFHESNRSSSKTITKAMNESPTVV